MYHIRRPRKREKHVIARIKCHHYFHYIHARTKEKQQWVKPVTSQTCTLPVDVIRKAFSQFKLATLCPNQQWVTARRVTRGHYGGNFPPIPKVTLTSFRLIMLLMCKPKECLSANQRNCLKNLFCLNF